MAPDSWHAAVARACSSCAFPRTHLPPRCSRCTRLAASDAAVEWTNFRSCHRRRHGAGCFVPSVSFVGTRVLHRTGALRRRRCPGSCSRRAARRCRAAVRGPAGGPAGGTSTTSAASRRPPARCRRSGCPATCRIWPSWGPPPSSRGAPPRHSALLATAPRGQPYGLKMLKEGSEAADSRCSAQCPVADQTRASHSAPFAVRYFHV